VAVHPSGKYLYAANEAGKASAVSAFAVDANSGKLTLLNQIPSFGEDPCYLSFDKTGKYVLVANYSSGTIAVFPILADGRLGEHTALLKDQGANGSEPGAQAGAARALDGDVTGQPLCSGGRPWFGRSAGLQVRCHGRHAHAE